MLEHLSCEERLRELGLSRQEKRWLWADQTADPNAYQKVARNTVRDIVGHGRKTRDNRHKLKQELFRVDIHFSPMRMVQHWKKLPREAVQSLSSLGGVEDTTG